ncbi:MAG: hypothetical protein JWP28_1373 [Phenylobacterium sp.]|nr:hypothetical protein [Phenylobacterium sp.]MDB5463838.1 hypothetical protein [Phenylobacterium sp.]MDB5497342.1 hypothetical protein [Phenylobacterium sp.]
MAAADTVIATFADHPAAELAIGKLAGAGFAPKTLSIVGQRYHSRER